MSLNIALLKEHPYATGGVVIVGGIVVFYLLSSGSSASASGSSSGSNYANALAADTQLAQVQAATTVQTNAQQAQLQQTAIQAQVANNQTAADLSSSNLNTYASLIASLYGTQQSVAENQSNNDAQTTQQANQLLYAQNIQSLQDSVLTDQIDQAANISENNNATSLAGLVDQLNYGTNIATLQTGLQSQGLTEDYNLAQQQEADFQTNVNTIIPQAGQQKNSALDAQDQTALFQTILSGGNPGVAATGTSTSAETAIANAATSAGLIGTVIKTGGTVLSGLFG